MAEPAEGAVNMDKDEDIYTGMSTPQNILYTLIETNVCVYKSWAI